MEEEILKISYDENNNWFRSHWKSEDRRNISRNAQSFKGSQTINNGKPPINSPKSKDLNFNQFKDKFNHTKIASFKQTHYDNENKDLSKTLIKKWCSTKSFDLSMKKAQSTINKIGKSPRKAAKNQPISQIINKFEDLIQQKKEALGIKPLDSTLSNYRAVQKENEKLQKLVEEQK